MHNFAEIDIDKSLLPKKDKIVNDVHQRKCLANVQFKGQNLTARLKKRKAFEKPKSEDVGYP